MAQFLRPDGTTTAPPSVSSGATSNAHLLIDESTAVDSDYFYSGDNQNASPAFTLSDPGLTPGSGTCTVRWRHTQVDGGAVNSTGGSASSITVVIEQSGVGDIATSSSTNTNEGSWATSSFTFNTSAVSNWANLSIRFDISGGGGSPSSRRGAGVSWAEVETPDGATTPFTATGLAITGTGSASVGDGQGAGAGETLAITGTGSASVSDGQGAASGEALAITGTGSVSVSDPETVTGGPFTADGLAITGTGSVSVSDGQGAASGETLAITGTGSVSVSDGQSAASGETLAITGTGSASVSDGQGAASGETLAITGTGSASVSDPATLSDAAFTADGLAITGTGSASVSDGQGAASGEALAITGTGLVVVVDLSPGFVNRNRNRIIIRPSNGAPTRELATYFSDHQLVDTGRSIEYEEPAEPVELISVWGQPLKTRVQVGTITKDGHGYPVWKQEFSE